MKKIGIPVKRWGDSYRVKVRGKSGRMVWVSNLSKPSHKRQIAKLYPKAFPRDLSVNDRVNTLQKAISKPKQSYSKIKRKAKCKRTTFTSAHTLLCAEEVLKPYLF